MIKINRKNLICSLIFFTTLTLTLTLLGTSTLFAQPLYIPLPAPVSESTTALHYKPNFMNKNEKIKYLISRGIRNYDTNLSNYSLTPRQPYLNSNSHLMFVSPMVIALESPCFSENGCALYESSNKFFDSLGVSGEGGVAIQFAITNGKNYILDCLVFGSNATFRLYIGTTKEKQTFQFTTQTPTHITYLYQSKANGKDYIGLTGDSSNGSWGFYGCTITNVN
ncbi:MAG: hypothetical protein HQK49_04725 [Oligoflexia bacterium]|nr:hypothetical protein [Oligoflexia bacterium]